MNIVLNFELENESMNSEIICEVNIRSYPLIVFSSVTVRNINYSHWLFVFYALLLFGSLYFRELRSFNVCRMNCIGICDNGVSRIMYRQTTLKVGAPVLPGPEKLNESQ